MAKGKRGKIKTGIRRRKDTNNIGKEKDKIEEDEVSSCSTEPHETITSFLKQEEVQELLNTLQMKDLVSFSLFHLKYFFKRIKITVFVESVLFA